MINILQRICWNNREWKLPSGSSNEKGFPGENGFGHEEWNFQLSDTWNGFIFPYTYITPQKKILNQNNGIFNIGYFTRHQEKNEWFLVGIHHNAELIASTEYSEIIKYFNKEGVFERRADELLAATSKFKNKKEAIKEVIEAFKIPYIKVKSPVNNIEFFSQPIPIKKPANHRFNSFTYLDKPHLKSINILKYDETPSSALAEDGYFRESASILKIIIPKHNKLSNDFTEWLKQNGISARQEENYVDIIFTYKDISYMAELKIVYGTGTTRSIREAIGQLFEYNYYYERKKMNEWMIILDQQPLKTDKMYIKKIIKEHSIPLRIGWKSDNRFEFFPKWDIKTE